VDLDAYVKPSRVGLTATDPGSDDLTLMIDWGDGTVETQLFPNNATVVPDPDPSVEMNPRSITATATHAYTVAGTYTIRVTVVDDDGGMAVVSTTVMI